MHIEWAQIVTHMIGFILAVWLLKRYAWSSLIGFVEKRRETIASQFAEIERAKTALAEQKQRYDHELENIEVARRDRIQEAAQEAEKLASDIKEEARREAVAAREKAKQDIAIELDKANELLKDRIIEAVFTTTEKVIKERLDKDKHNKLIDDFLAEVQVKS